MNGAGSTKEPRAPSIRLAGVPADRSSSVGWLPANGWDRTTLNRPVHRESSKPCFSHLVALNGDLRLYLGEFLTRRTGYSNASGTSAMFFSPAAFFSLYFFTQSSQCLPAARSLPLNSSRAISA